MPIVKTLSPVVDMCERIRGIDNYCRQGIYRIANLNLNCRAFCTQNFQGNKDIPTMIEILGLFCIDNLVPIDFYGNRNQWTAIYDLQQATNCKNGASIEQVLDKYLPLETVIVINSDRVVMSVMDQIPKPSPLESMSRKQVRLTRSADNILVVQQA